MKKLQELAVADNASEAYQVNGSNVAVKVTTTASSTITVQRSIDGADFVTVPDLSWTIDGKDEFNLSDLVEGQFIKIIATSGAMTAVKVLG